MTQIEMGKKYRTRDGREVRILATDVRGSAETVAAAVLSENGKEDVMTYYSDGRYYDDESSPNDNDLIEMKPEIKKVINLYKNGLVYAYDTPEQAALYGSRNYHGQPRIATKEITFIEGEGLSNAGE